jgi:hypothetical protein
MREYGDCQPGLFQYRSPQELTDMRPCVTRPLMHFGRIRLRTWVRLGAYFLYFWFSIGAWAQIESFEVASIKPNRSTDRRAQAQYKAFTDVGR